MPACQALECHGGRESKLVGHAVTSSEFWHACYIQVRASWNERTAEEIEHEIIPVEDIKELYPCVRR